MKIELDMRFVTLNEYIEAERSNKYSGAKIKKEQTNNVCLLARNKLKLNTGLYDVNFTWIKPDNKIDHDNIAFAKKFILDGFVKAGAIENDNCKYIRNFTDTFILNRSKNIFHALLN